MAYPNWLTTPTTPVAPVVTLGFCRQEFPGHGRGGLFPGRCSLEFDAQHPAAGASAHGAAMGKQGLDEKLYIIYYNIYIYIINYYFFGV